MSGGPYARSYGGGGAEVLPKWSVFSLFLISFLVFLFW